MLTRAAYDAAGAVWGTGPTAVYDELARPLVEAAGDVRGCRALDVGTGSGVVADQLAAAGAVVTASDQSLGMLRHEASSRPPAVVADVLALPFAAGAFDVVTAGFVLNHLSDAVAGVRELARVGRRLVATTFADEAAPDVKLALQRVLEAHGFTSPAWYADLRGGPLYQPSPGEACDVLVAAGLEQVRVERHDVVLRLTADQVMAWRWGMAQTAGFVRGLPPEQRLSMEADGRAALGSLDDLVFPILVMAGQSS